MTKFNLKFTSFMRSLLSIVLILVTSLNIHASFPQKLIAHLKDNTTHSFILGEKTKISFGSNIEIKDDYISLSFAKDELQKLEYSNETLSSVRNPISDDITIRFEADSRILNIYSASNSLISVVDMTGFFVKTQAIRAEINTLLDLGDLPSGVYIIKLGKKTIKLQLL